MTEKLEDKAGERKEEEPIIDANVPWHEGHNLNAARKLGVWYDKRGVVYRDSDGCPVLDEFGQPLG